MKFELTETELKRLEEWRYVLKIVLNVKDLEGTFTYSFTPTGIGDGVDVKYVHTDKRKFIKELTDYDSW